MFNDKIFYSGDKARQRLQFKSTNSTIYSLVEQAFVRIRAGIKIVAEIVGRQFVLRLLAGALHCG